MTDDELDEILAALPHPGPAPEFADCVMARVTVADPFALRSLQAAPRRLFHSRRALAVAAMLAMLVVSSMAASVVWTLSHQEVLVSFGHGLAVTIEQWAWRSMRAVASNLIEQPSYIAFRGFASNLVRLAVASALASLAYVGGLLALRRLLALPDQWVTHVRG